MDSLLFYSLIIENVISLLFACAGYYKAKKKYRSPWLWAIICYLTGLIGYIVVCCTSELDFDEELEYTTENDTAGFVMIILAIIWTIFWAWIGWGNGLESLGIK